MLGVLYSSSQVILISERSRISEGVPYTLLCSIVWTTTTIRFCWFQAPGLFDITVSSLISQFVSDAHLRHIFAYAIHKSCLLISWAGNWSDPGLAHLARAYMYVSEDAIIGIYQITKSFRTIKFVRFKHLTHKDASMNQYRSRTTQSFRTKFGEVVLANRNLTMYCTAFYLLIKLCHALWEIQIYLFQIVLIWPDRKEVEKF